VDPITILAACTAVWNGIKKASEFAQEAEGVWSQLSKYAGLADQLEQHITTAKNKPRSPSSSVIWSLATTHKKPSTSLRPSIS
jgi:hypothetical protein